MAVLLVSIVSFLHTHVLNMLAVTSSTENAPVLRDLAVMTASSHCAAHFPRERTAQCDLVHHAIATRAGLASIATSVLTIKPATHSWKPAKVVSVTRMVRL